MSYQFKKRPGLEAHLKPGETKVLREGVAITNDGPQTARLHIIKVDQPLENFGRPNEKSQK